MSDLFQTSSSRDFFNAVLFFDFVDEFFSVGPLVSLLVVFYPLPGEDARSMGLSANYSGLMNLSANSPLLVRPLANFVPLMGSSVCLLLFGLGCILPLPLPVCGFSDVLSSSSVPRESSIPACLFHFRDPIPDFTPHHASWSISYLCPTSGFFPIPLLSGPSSARP